MYGWIDIEVKTRGPAASSACHTYCVARDSRFHAPDTFGYIPHTPTPRRLVAADDGGDIPCRVLVRLSHLHGGEWSCYVSAWGKAREISYCYNTSLPIGPRLGTCQRDNNMYQIPALKKTTLRAFLLFDLTARLGGPWVEMGPYGTTGTYLARGLSLAMAP